MDFEFIEDATLRTKAVEAFKVSTDAMKVEFQNSLKSEIDKAIAPIKTNHDKLLDEKKKLQDRFKDITDPAEALAALALVNENEDFKLIKDGKIDEVIAKKTSQLIADHDAKVYELSGKLNEHEMTGTKYKSLYRDTVRDLEIRRAAIAAGVTGESIIQDILRQGQNIFKVGDDERSVEARDSKGHLVKLDEKTFMNTDNWVESLKRTHPHYWPPSQGGNFNPGITGLGDLEAQIQAAAKSGNTTLYRQLRDKQKAATK